MNDNSPIKRCMRSFSLPLSRGRCSLPDLLPGETYDPVLRALFPEGRERGGGKTSPGGKSVEETFPGARAGKKAFCTSVLITVVPYSATVY